MAGLVALSKCPKHSVVMLHSELCHCAQVSKHWAPVRQWQAFLAITHVGHHVLAALDVSSKADCIWMAVTVLREELWHNSANGPLGLLVVVLRGAPASLGQTFIDAGGPEQLVHSVRLEDDDRQNAAVKALLEIANNGELANVMAELVRHAGVDVETLCENFLPCASDVQELQGRFLTAFNRLPGWATLEVCNPLREVWCGGCSSPCYTCCDRRTTHASVRWV
jgi:hypothetical protein